MCAAARAVLTFALDSRICAYLSDLYSHVQTGSSVQSKVTKMLQDDGLGLGICRKAQCSCKWGSRVNHDTWSDGCSDGDTSQDGIKKL